MITAEMGHFSVHKQKTVSRHVDQVTSMLGQVVKTWLLMTRDMTVLRSTILKGETRDYSSGLCWLAEFETS